MPPEGAIMNITIRPEIAADYRSVEELTRKAFWNVHVPGCDEHYLVHIMRSHRDFCADLDFVAEYEGKIIGNIMYTKSSLFNDKPQKLETLTFGPVSVLPEFQRKGVGKQLIQHTIKLARAQGYQAIVIYGNPANYVTHGFKNCKNFGVGLEDGKHPTCMLVLPLQEGPFPEGKWFLVESEVYNLDKSAAEEFDKTFPEMEKKYTPSQEEFAILSRSIVL